MMGSRAPAGNMPKLQHTKHTIRANEIPRRIMPLIMLRITSSCIHNSYCKQPKKIAKAERRRSARRDGSSLASLVTPHFV